MEPDVSFVGVKLLPGKLTKVGGTTNPDSSIWTIHITQFALAAGAKAGKNIITLVESTGDSFALGTLEKDRCEQFQGDFMLSQEVQLLNQGKSEVHLTGYQTTTDIMDPEAELETDDEEDALDPSLLGTRRKAAIRAMNAGVNGLPEEDDSDDDEDFDAEDEEEEEDDDIIDDEDDAEVPEGVPLVQAQQLQKALQKGKKMQEESEEDESDSDELDDEEAELLADAAREAGLDEDEEEDDDSDEEDDEEDSEVDLENPEDQREEEELQKTSKILKQQKRSAEAGKATPQPNKKAKLEASTPTAADGDKQWSTAIKAYLVKEGPTLLSSLGSHVKKPAGVSRKLKKLLEDSKEFSIDSKGLVGLSR